MKPIYAICGTVYFSIFAIFMLTHGDHRLQGMTCTALIAAAMGQFFAQGDDLFYTRLATVLTYFAVFMSIALNIFFSLS